MCEFVNDKLLDRYKILCLSVILLNCILTGGGGYFYPVLVWSLYCSKKEFSESDCIYIYV